MVTLNGNIFKTCTKCLESKLLTDFDFRSDRPGSIKSQCRACAEISQRIRSLRHRAAQYARERELSAPVLEPYHDDPWSWAFVIFREAPEFPGYGIDTEGNLWSRIAPRKSGRRGRIRGPWRKLHPNRGSDGYITTALSTAPGVKVAKRIHRLVLEVFVGPCPEGMEACHFPDPTRSNNRLRNLRWDTDKANVRDRYTCGNGLFGSQVHLAKLKEGDIPEIFGLRRRGIPVKEIAKMHNVSCNAIYNIISRTTWKHVMVS